MKWPTYWRRPWRSTACQQGSLVSFQCTYPSLRPTKYSTSMHIRLIHLCTISKKQSGFLELVLFRLQLRFRSLLKRVQDSRRFLLPFIIFVTQYWHVPLRFQFMGVKMACFKDLDYKQIQVTHSVAFFIPSSENFNYHILVHKLGTGFWVFKPPA